MSNSRVQEYIIENNMYEFLNYEFSRRYSDDSFLIAFLDKYKYGDWRVDRTREELESYLHSLEGYISRELTSTELDYINEDYYEDN